MKKKVTKTLQRNPIHRRKELREVMLGMGVRRERKKYMSDSLTKIILSESQLLSTSRLNR